MNFSFSFNFSFFCRYNVGDNYNCNFSDGDDVGGYDYFDGETCPYLQQYKVKLLFLIMLNLDDF